MEPKQKQYPAVDVTGQEYQSGWPIPSQGDLANPGIEPGSPELQVDFYQLSYQVSFIKKHSYFQETD